MGRDAQGGTLYWLLGAMTIAALTAPSVRAQPELGPDAPEPSDAGSGMDDRPEAERVDEPDGAPRTSEALAETPPTETTGPSPAEPAARRPRPRDETDSPIVAIPEATERYELPPRDPNEPLRLTGPPPRTLGQRYSDALGGSWAGTGLLVLGAGVTLGAVGLAVGCPLGGGLGCVIGVSSGLSLGGMIGWFIGPGIGTARGAGLDPGEAFAPWALGVLSNGTVVAIAAGIGAAIDSSSGGFGNPGLTWGLAVGAVLGAMLQVFMTPLYAVLMYEDRPEAPSIDPSISPYAAPTEGGFTAGLTGAF